MQFYCFKLRLIEVRGQFIGASLKNIQDFLICLCWNVCKLYDVANIFLHSVVRSAKELDDEILLRLGAVEVLLILFFPPFNAEWTTADCGSTLWTGLSHMRHSFSMCMLKENTAVYWTDCCKIMVCTAFTYRKTMRSILKTVFSEYQQWGF